MTLSGENFKFGNRRHTAAAEAAITKSTFQIQHAKETNLVNPNFLKTSMRPANFETGSFLNRLSVDAASSSNGV